MFYLDGQILANSLVSLKGTDLRMVYALFCKTNIGDLLFSKTKDFFSKEESDNFTRHLEEEVSKIEHKNDNELQVNIFLEITRLLKLRGTKYSLDKEITDQCSNISNDVFAQLQKQDKNFRKFSESKSNSSKLQLMVQYQMSKVFNEIDNSFQDFSIQDQTKFANQVNEYIHSLPIEKQNKIKEKLGVNDLTDEMVRKAIATSGTSIVFAIIVEVSGFAFYTTATSLVASFAGLFGLTLPFGFYTGLTSTIAVLANPLFILPLLLGGGALLINHQNKALRKKLLPIIVMQIALPYMSGGTGSVKSEPFIKEWHIRYDKALNLTREMKKLALMIKDITNEISEKEQTITYYKNEIYSCETEILKEKQNILYALKHYPVDQLDVNESFRTHSNKYQKGLMKIESLKTKKYSTVSTGIFNRIGNSISNFSTSLDIRNKQGEAEDLLDTMVEDILSSESMFKKVEREKVNLLKDKIQQLKKNKYNESKNILELEEKMKRYVQQQSSYQKQLKNYEKEHYGLADIL